MLQKLDSGLTLNIEFFRNQPCVNIGRISRYMKARQMEIELVKRKATEVYNTAVDYVENQTGDMDARKIVIKIHKILFYANFTAAHAHVAIVLYHLARAIAATEPADRTIVTGGNLDSKSILDGLQLTLVKLRDAELRLEAVLENETPSAQLSPSQELADSLDAIARVVIGDDGALRGDTGAPAPDSREAKYAGAQLREFWDLRANLSMLHYQREYPGMLFTRWFNYPDGAAAAGLDPGQLRAAIRNNSQLSSLVSEQMKQTLFSKLESFGALDQMAMCDFILALGIDTLRENPTIDNESQFERYFKHLWLVYTAAEKTKRFAESAIDYILAVSSESERREFLTDTVDLADTNATKEQPDLWRKRLMNNLLIVTRINISEYLRSVRHGDYRNLAEYHTVDNPDLGRHLRRVFCSPVLPNHCGFAPKRGFSTCRGTITIGRRTSAKYATG